MNSYVKSLKSGLNFNIMLLQFKTNVMKNLKNNDIIMVFIYLFCISINETAFCFPAPLPLVCDITAVFTTLLKFFFFFLILYLLLLKHQYMTYIKFI